MDKSFRKLDEMTVSAEYRARSIYSSFMERMMGKRAELEQQMMQMPEVQDARTNPAGANLQEEI